MNNLIICITDELNPIEQLNKKIIDDLKDKWIYLIKNDLLFASIMLYSGYVNDRRDWSEIETQKSELSGLRYTPKRLEVDTYRINGEEYRYSQLFNDLKNDSKKDSELLINNFLKKDNGKLEKYLDIFRNYIFDLIDECNHFIIEEMNMREYFYYKKYLSYEYYDEIIYKDTKSPLYSRRIFDISKKDYKDIFKKILIFNINDTDNEYIELHVNRDYIHNNREDYNYANSIHFLKEGKELFSLETNTGDITDFRDKEKIERHIEKYRKIEI